MILALVLYLINCQRKEKSSYSLKTSFMKEYTLSSPVQYLKNHDNRIASLYRKITGGKDKDENNHDGNWYYVHFIHNNYTDIYEYISIQRKDQINKNSFILFLTKQQLEMISNITLVKKLEPSDKYIENKSNKEESNYLIVTTIPNFKLLTNNDDYKVIKRNQKDTIIIQINENLDNTEFKNKKMKVIKALSEIPEIKTISTYYFPASHNAIISGFTQKNRFDFKLHESGYLYLNRFLNDKGIDGKDQIITIFDTPIDIYHSMFRDNDVPIELNKYIPNHRKIIYYNFNGTLEDLKQTIELNEHGTHVAGTAAGKSSCSKYNHDVYNFNGIAPEAKIIYGGHFNKVNVVDEIENLMFKYNSRITSNSWGTKVFDNYNNYLYGSVAYISPDISYIFSSGNEHDVRGNFTVGDPGGSKNVITVGAISDFYDANPLQAYLIHLESSSIINIRKALNEIDPWISGTIGTEPYQSTIFAVNMSNGEKCHLIDKDNFTIIYGPPDNWVNKCNYSTNSQVFQPYDEDKFIEVLNNKQGNTVKIITIFTYNNKENPKLTRVSFSSTGPANYGILKPDVMAPGERIVSAKSLSNSNTPHGCLDDVYGDFIFMSGTSMATPNIGGAMALIHQYFDSGKWIDKVKLDGATSRALLINSCKHPSNSKIPDIMVGHGVVDLSTILPVDNDFGVRITRQNSEKYNEAINQSHSVSENGHAVSKLLVDTTSTKKKLQITLSYLDPMLSIESPIPITRDLDLIVISPTKKVFYGDHLSTNDTQHASTNEKIIIDEDEVENGEYTIHVFGGAFTDIKNSESSTSNQTFSVAASGPIKNGYLEFHESTECLCENCDPNNPGLCLCNESENIGPLCQVKIQTTNENNAEANVGPLEIKRIRFVSNKKIKSVVAKSDHPGQYATIWVSTKCHLTLGEYEAVGETGNTNSKKEKKTSADFGSKEVCVAIFNNNDQYATYEIKIINKSNLNIGLIVGVVIGSVALIAIIVIVVICCVKHGFCKKSSDNDEKSISEND